MKTDAISVLKLAVGTGWLMPPCVREVHCTVSRRRN